MHPRGRAVSPVQSQHRALLPALAARLWYHGKWCIIILACDTPTQPVDAAVAGSSDRADALVPLTSDN